MAEHSVLQDSLLATFILPIAQALRLRGVDAMALVEGVGIDPAGVINPDRRISVTQMHELLHRSIEASGDEAFGLLAAEQLQPQVLHGLGLAWLASDTVYDGLKGTVRFSKLMATAVAMELSEEGEFVHLTLRAGSDLDNFVPAVRDFAVAIIVRMCRLTTGDFIAPIAVKLERPTPEEPERWEYMLACHVKFDCEVSRVSWYRADILEPLATGNPTLARINDEQAEHYLNSFLSKSTTRDVVGKIVERLPDGPPSQQQIAASLNVSNRSVVETAYLLGFSEPSTFSRAFKRWTGTAPAEYREQAHKPQGE